MYYFVVIFRILFGVLGVGLLATTAVYGFYTGVCVVIGQCDDSSLATSSLLGIVGLICSALWFKTMQHLETRHCVISKYSSLIKFTTSKS